MHLLDDSDGLLQTVSFLVLLQHAVVRHLLQRASDVECDLGRVIVRVVGLFVGLFELWVRRDGVVVSLYLLEEQGETLVPSRLVLFVVPFEVDCWYSLMVGRDLHGNRWF